MESTSSFCLQGTHAGLTRSRTHHLLVFFLVNLCGAATLFAQNTDISIGTTTLQPSVKRLGINLGTLDYYDSGQTTQNLLMNNPGFEGQIWNSTIRCASGTATTCTDEDQWSGWPGGFWNGATFEVFYGAAAGRTGTVTSSTAPGNGQGLTLNFANAGPAPSAGDYLIVRKTVPGGASGGWWPSTYLNGSITDNMTDLPPGTLGKQTVVLTAPTSTDAASISGFFDSVAGKTFLQLNGTYQLQFKAKGIGGSNQVKVTVSRNGVATYYSQPVALSGAWNTYTVNFNAAENGSAIGIGGVNFATVGADAFELDDVTLVKTNGDPSNTTAFRDPVVNALRTLQPGILRYWGGQLGDTLDNLLVPQFGRQRAGYSAWWTESDSIDYGLQDFLVLCQTVGAEPWFVVPSTFSTTDASNLIEYLGGSSSTVYGAKRIALGQTTPWTQVFSKIHLEFGNEAWNGTFKGASIEYSAPYGGRAQAIFGAMQANPSFVANSFDMVLGGQAAYVGRNSDIQNNCNNNTSFAIAPYTMNQVDSYSDNESLYGSTFAEPEALMSSSGSAEGLAPGMIYQNYQAIQASSHPVPLSFYEINLSTLNGVISQDALNSYTPSLGAGLMVADTMLLSLRQFGVVNQELFALPQYSFVRPDGKTALLWGSVVDMGVTDRKRPQYLALQLANQALSNGAAMIQTTHTGADPTWNQPYVNSVQLNGAHFLHSFAFSNNGTYSTVVFNLSRSSALPVTFSGSNAPTGTVQMQQLTSANPGDTNENANVVNIVASTLNGFAGSSGLSLPPYSMTVLTWNTTSNPAPQISAVASSNISGSSATITWTTDQPSSSLVNYGSSNAYGSASPLNSAMATAHSVTLAGLTPGATYNYQVVSTNSTGTTATSANYTFATTATPAPVVSAVAATAITVNSVTIVWNTDQASSSLVQYGSTTSYGSTSALNSSLSASHSVTISGLTAGTLYNYAVVSSNASGKSVTSGNFTFTTLTQAPVISAVSSTYIGTTSATIVWTTDQASSSQVQYGTTSSYGSSSALNASLVTTHSIVLSGLAPGATYNYAVSSANFAGNSATSANFSFTTVSAAPAISAVTASNITGSSATIAWTTDQSSNSRVVYGTTTAYGLASGVNYTLVTAHSVSLTGLTPGTTYNYAVVSQNAGGNSTTSSNFAFTTSQAAASSNPGPQVGYVAFWAITGSSVTISWSTNVLATTAVSYGTTSALGQTSAVQTTLTASHGVILTGLTGGTTYYFVAQSSDASGNTGYSAVYSFTTINTNPPVISGIMVTPGSNNRAIIGWTTNVLSVNWVTFGPTTAYGHWSQFTSATTNPQPNMGWVPSGVVHYQLHSVDPSGHEEDSPDYTFVEP